MKVDVLTKCNLNMDEKKSDLISLISNSLSEFFLQKESPKKIAVAVSGGCDSIALCFLLKDFCQKHKIILHAVTFDHGYRKNSAQEAQSLSKMLKAKKIKHHIITNSHKIAKSNIEAEMRQQRYEALYQYCLDNEIKYLFLGHQLDDVAENFLIRLFRGSGLDGLSTMAQISSYKKITLVRPLLNFTKDELKNFLNDKEIKWFEDETNGDEKFLRNKIRNFLTTFSDKNIIQNRIKSASDEITQMRDFIDEIILEKARDILQFDGQSFLIEQKKFGELPQKIALKILALVLMEVSGKVYKPRLEQLKNFYNYLIFGDKIKPRNFYGCMAKMSDKKYLKIEREEAAQDLENIVKYDEILFLVDGRFLTKYPNKKYSAKTHKFYFRTILGSVFSI